LVISVPDQTPAAPVLAHSGAVAAQPAVANEAADPRSAARAEQVDSAPPNLTVEQSLASASPAAQALYRQLPTAFAGQFAPVRPTTTYRLGVLLVSLVMVLLPLVYIALIGVVCYGVYYHMVQHTGIVTAGRGRGAVLALIAYLAPLVIGCILIFFMIKPLFARPSRERRIRSLGRAGEPILFEFVDHICAAVGAPRPSRVDIDCEVNASASFRRGIWSMLTGGDLVLTIGMPLVAGLSVRQLAGVLAHEFGHFSQGVGMRLSYLIRAISHWFTRVVYERDTWDDWLSRSTEGLDLRIAWVLYLAKLFVWLTRKILWVLMMIGHGVSGYLLRQMEFDADRYEARLAGSETFETTCRRLHELMAAYQKSQNDLGRFYREGRLGDNLPKLIQVNLQEIPAEVRTELDAAIDQSQTGWFDTHPADRARIESARRERAAGILHIDQPAADLFIHYDHLCRGVTWDFYRGIFGPAFQPSQMHSVDDLLARQQQEKGASAALDRFCLGGFNILRPLRLPTVHVARPASAKQEAARLKQARQQMIDERPAYQKTWTQYDQADTHTLQAAGAAAMFRAGLPLRGVQFEIPVDSREHIRRARESARSEMQQLTGALEPFEDALGQRLVSALQLLFVPQVAERLERAATWQSEAPRLLPLLQNLSGQLRATAEIRNLATGMELLVRRLEGNQSNQSYVEALTELGNDAGEALGRVYTSLSNEPYPFDHSDATMTVSRFLMPDGPPVKGDTGAQYDAAGQFVDRLQTLYPRVASRLAEMAEAVERVLGLQPLETSEPG
jgi:Zn-dependent protease with chaperone function